MADNTFWIAALTGGTAVLASRGNTRAARIQADAATATQRIERLHDARRAAYLDLIHHGQRMADLYWKSSEAHRFSGPESRQALLKESRDRIRDAYGDLRRAVRVIELEGPDAAPTAAYAVKQATTDPYQPLNSILAGVAGAEDRFDAAYHPYWVALSHFIDTAKSALQET
ncbi:hypothetical protein AB5J52_49955 (plasmid) [Streptomyces sp. R39]|uniref:Uncharacterized protein n=1 Tax=Streptomyces sp. R39 TaxID=3238631 RepID=A0AB39R6N9_9ACTN